MKYILTIIYLIFTVSGIYLLKLGGDSLAVSFKQGLEVKMGYITLFGLICYVISFLIWQKVLVSFDLTYIVPITTGISQVLIVIIGLAFLKEKINWMGLLGIGLVIIGVIFMTVGKGKV